MPRCEHDHVDTRPSPQPSPAAPGLSSAPPPAPLPDLLRLSSTPQRSPLPATLPTGLSSTPLPAILPTAPCSAGSVSEPASLPPPSSHATSEVPPAQPLTSPRPARRERKRGRKTATSAASPLDRCESAGLPTAPAAPSGSLGRTLFGNASSLPLPLVQPQPLPAPLLPASARSLSASSGVVTAEPCGVSHPKIISVEKFK